VSGHLLLGGAEGELGAEGGRGLVVLQPGDDLGEVSVNDEDALAVVGRGEIAAEGIKLGLNLGLGRVVGKVSLGNLNDEAADSAGSLLNLTLHGDGLRGAQAELSAGGSRGLVGGNPGNDLREVRVDDESALAVVGAKFDHKIK